MLSSDPPSCDRGVRFVLHVVPALVYVIAVFYVGSIPMPPLPEVSTIGTDKIGHGLAFFGMALVFVRAGRYLMRTLPDASLRIAAAVASSAAGGLLEIYQLAVPGRSADVLDWVADCVGAAVAALAIRSRWVSRLESRGPVV